MSFAAVAAIAFFLLGVMVIWSVTGGLWERKAGTIDFRQLYRDRIALSRSSETAISGEDATELGAADRIQEQLYGGTFIPGFSKAPEVLPSVRQQQERDRREREKPLREATQRQAIQDLRQRLGGVPKEDVALVSWSERTWMDSALGCAQPGEVMVPAQLPGWMFVFSFAGDRTSFYVYNATRDGRQLRFCRRERKSTEV